MEQLSKEQAIGFDESRSWESMTHVQIAVFQLNQDRLCMPFDVFHEAIEKTLGRPVWTHEFTKPAALRLEMARVLPEPSIVEIVGKLDEMLSGKLVTEGA